MVTKPSSELKLVGGDPALDFVNTAGDDRVTDPLEDYSSFVAWAARIGAIDDGAADRLTAIAAERPAAAERALTEARALRAVIDAVFRPLARDAGGEPPPAALARLVQRAGAAVERARLVRADGGFVPARQVRTSGGFVLAWEGDHLERPLWPLAVAALDLLRGGPLDRLKACESCPWLFLDTSRNRSRRWCSMDECGVRIKMRRYRARASR